jgi:hypothetical protein
MAAGRAAAEYAWESPLPELRGPKNPNSQVWDHIRIVVKPNENGGTHMCLLCLEKLQKAGTTKWDSAIFKFGSDGTANQRRHLLNAHDMKFEQPKVEKDLKRKLETLERYSFVKPSRTQATELEPGLISIMDENFMRFVISSAEPLSIGQNPWLKRWVGDPTFGLLPGYQPPGRAATITLVKQHWSKFNTTLKDALQQTAKSFRGMPFLCLLHDGCTFASKDSMIGFSVCFIDPGWCHNIVAVGLIPVNQGHAGATVAEVIKEEFSSRFDFTLDSVLCSSCSDSASNAKKVSELLGV